MSRHSYESPLLKQLAVLEEEQPVKASRFYQASGMNERTVRRLLKKYEKKGLVTIEKKGLGLNKGVASYVKVKENAHEQLLTLARVAAEKDEEKVSLKKMVQSKNQS
jgi:DNA-binding transcriptional ArsR family regulator